MSLLDSPRDGEKTQTITHARSERGSGVGMFAAVPWLDRDVSTTVIDQAQLTTEDRCDACGAQAYVRVELDSGELYFCGHHATKHLDALQGRTRSILDERDRIKDL